MKLYDAKGMREADRHAIEEVGIPGVVLMENAGRGAVGYLQAQAGGRLSQGVTLLAGRGNNGGDAHVMARYLHGMGIPIQWILFGRASDVEGDAGVHLQIGQRLGIPLTEVMDHSQWVACRDAALSSGVVVDGLLGTGLSRAVEGLLAEVITDVNAATASVLSLDIPTGVSADEGRLLGPAIRAEFTATFGGLKVGLCLTPGALHAGRVKVIDIGLPQDALNGSACGELLSDAWVRVRVPRRPVDGHKGNFGHLLVVAGGRGKLGAALMCGMAALRSGVGLVTLALPEGALETSMSIPPELMVISLPDGGGGHLTSSALAVLKREAEGKDAVALGPGLGMELQVGQVVRGLLSFGLPTVVDADGLNVLDVEDFAEISPAPRVLTPHPGEMGRLLDLGAADVQDSRFHCCRRLSALSGATVVLKGARTVIDRPGEGILVNSTGNEGMATAGSGDVLTGLIGGLLAQGLSPGDAAGVAVFIHGRAGDLAAEQRGRRSMVATDVISSFGSAWASLTEK